MPPLCKEIELNCFSTVLHPPPSPSGHGPITMLKVQIVCLPPHLYHLPAKERHNISAFQKKKKNRLNPSYSWIWWSRKTTSHLNLMTCDGSCHGAPVQFCKSHCKSESVHKAQYTLHDRLQRGMMLRSVRGQQWIKHQRTNTNLWHCLIR